LVDLEKVQTLVDLEKGPDAVRTPARAVRTPLLRSLIDGDGDRSLLWTS
jgi:hypothetical protein